MLARMAYKFVRGRWVSWTGQGVAADWEAKLRVCSTCPLRTAAGGVFYCGTPAWRRIGHGGEGCGCPVSAKAKLPGEHCPLDTNHLPVSLPVLPPQADPLTDEPECPCKWCAAARPIPSPSIRPSVPTSRTTAAT